MPKEIAILLLIIIIITDAIKSNTTNPTFIFALYKTPVNVILYVTNIIDPIIQNKYFVLQAYENRLNRMKENNVDEKSLLVLTNSYIESYEQKFL